MTYSAHTEAEYIAVISKSWDIKMNLVIYKIIALV